MIPNERLFGLIGYPLSHSFSKKYFTEKFMENKISNCRYELFPISSIALLKNIIDDHPTLCGLNVTIPYKESVFPFLDKVSVQVQEIGACNCIRIRNGILEGFNTDVIGFERMLLPFIQPHHQRALILGTGGAAKAVAWVLNKIGINFLYVSREADNQKISYQEVDSHIMRDYSIVINTTPLGMSPSLEACPDIPYSDATAQHLFVDLIYNPSKTKFLGLAEKQGASIVNGLEMLIIQAEESWKIWNEKI